MTGIYNLAAIPFLFPEGEFKGELKGVTFVATSKADTKQWFTINCGQFETAFSKLIPAGLAREIIAVLTRGNDIEFPGLYQKEQFDGGFNYEWSPVHFELPPSVRPSGNAGHHERMYLDGLDVSNACGHRFGSLGRVQDSDPV